MTPVIEINSRQRFDTLEQAAKAFGLYYQKLGYHLRKYSFYESDGIRLEPEVVKVMEPSNKKAKEDQVAELVLKGFSTSQIIKDVSVSDRTVRSVIKRLGIDRREVKHNAYRLEIKKALDSGCKSIQDIADYAGVPYSCMYQRMLRIGFDFEDLPDSIKGRALKPGDRFGDWEVLSLAHKSSRRNGQERIVNIKYKCLCHGCNEVFEVAKKDLTDGRSLSCRKCGYSRRKDIPIVEVNSGLKFEVLTQAAKKFGIGHQTLAYHIRKYSFYESDGIRLELAPDRPKQLEKVG